MTGRWIIPVIAATLAARADAQPDAAKDHLARADRLFESHDYAKAVVELEAAYAIDPRPEILYNIAQARRLGGDCRGAIGGYESFLATGPEARFAANARENISRCRAIVGTAPATAASPLRPLATPEPERRPFYRDGVAVGLAASGLGLVVGGTIAWKLGRDDTRAANAATTYDAFARNAGGARMQSVGVGSIVVGVVLVAAGITKYALSPPRDRPVVSAGVGTDGEIYATGRWGW